MRSDCFPHPTLLVQLMRTEVCVPSVMLNQDGQNCIPKPLIMIVGCGDRLCLPTCRCLRFRPPARHNTRNHVNMLWLQARPARVHGNLLVLPGPSVVQHASIESQPRVWRNMHKTHPGNAACRATLSEPCSGDQRGRGLAFNLRVVGSDRDAASKRAGSGPYKPYLGVR